MGQGCVDSPAYHRAGAQDVVRERPGGAGGGQEQDEGMLEPAAGTTSAEVPDTSVVSFIAGSD